MARWAACSNPLRSILLTRIQAASKTNGASEPARSRFLKAVGYFRGTQREIFRGAGLAAESTYETTNSQGKVVTKHRWQFPRIQSFEPTPFGGVVRIRVRERLGQTPTDLVSKEEVLGAMLHCEDLRVLRGCPVHVLLEFHYVDPLAGTTSVDGAADMDGWFGEAP
ncbi:hypothetical protein [Frondihabitans peucedani]|uniref:Uncharacterized protein n=1 Tax=Frondihabitans peucedani TaxID=598626 RepID=A0ABP8E6A4_9MICO